MLKLMQKKALQLYIESEKNGNSSNEVLSEKPIKNFKSDGDIGRVNHYATENNLNADLGNGNMLGSRGIRIRNILEQELKPVELEVEDISYQHAGHAVVKGSDGETHFNVKIVSDEFEGKSLVKRHRLIYNLLQQELRSGLHALSIVAKTPAEV